MGDRSISPVLAGPEPSNLERRFAAADRILGKTLLALAGVCVAVAVLELVLFQSHSRAPLDGVVFPLVIGIVPAGSGGLLLLAERAMHQRTEARWMVQCGAVLAPLVFCLFVWLA